MEKTTPKKDIILSNIDPVRLPVHNLDTIGSDDHNGEPYDYIVDKHLRYEVDIPTNDDEGENYMSHDDSLGESPKSS